MVQFTTMHPEPPPPAAPAQRLLLLGATGAVGQCALAQALADPRVGQVVAPTRRPLPPHPRLFNPVTDFQHLPTDADWLHCDAVVCALGSTIRQAGSQAAFAAVDRDLPIALGRLARAAGARSFALNSSLGASLRGNFYLRTKAEAEAGLAQQGWPHLGIVRPSLIAAHRQPPRPGEVAGLWLARLLGPLVPRSYRPVRAEAIARCLLDLALSPRTDFCIVESAQLD
jgi:uncharacterized protein YbjT (DUF2867 family)